MYNNLKGVEEKIKMRKIKLFTHTDLDGVGCAIVAKVWALQEPQVTIDVTFCENSEVDEKVKFFLENSIEDYHECYITDLSVNEEVAELISSCQNISMMLLDHHVSALWLDSKSWAVVKPTDSWPSKPTCGTKLLYDELFPVTSNRRLANFVENVRLWDTWEWKKRNNYMPRFYSTLLSLRGRDTFIAELLPKLADEPEIPDGWESLMETELDNIQSYIDYVRPKAFKYEYEGNKYLCVYANKYISQLGNTLAEENPEYAGVFIFNDGAISIRGIHDDIDLSAIAKKMGGGGHKQAAGFVISEDKKKRIFDIIFEEEVTE